MSLTTNKMLCMFLACTNFIFYAINHSLINFWIGVAMVFWVIYLDRKGVR